MTSTVTDISTRSTRGKRTEVPATVRRQPGASPALDALTGAAGTQTVAIPLNLLHPHPDNPRKDLGDLTELADSIRAHGVRQNLLVVPDPDHAGEYRLVIGHRRTAAANLAGRATLPAVIDSTLTPAGQLELMLLENLQRTDLTAIEEADGYQGLLDLGVDEAAIAKNIGRSRATVASRLRLRTLPAAAREVVSTHQASLADADLLATTLARADVAASPESVARLTDDLGRPGFAHRVANEIQHLELQAARAAARTELEATGITVVDAGEYGGAPKNTLPLRQLGDKPGYDAKSLTPAKHAKCPGHVAWIGTYRAEPEFGCQNWKTHGHHDRYASSSSSAGSDLTTEQRREIVANNKAALAAEGVRRAWIRDELLARARMPADAVVYVAQILRVGHQAHYKERELHRQLVGDALIAVLEANEPPRTADTAMRRLVAHAAAQVEVQMEKDFWRKSDHRRGQFAHHLSTLASWGYELADVEQLVVTAATPEAGEPS
jgi:ParB/RepB/Spo0J family partition protein